MKLCLTSSRRILTVVIGSVLAPASLHASISGFGDFSGFTVNQADNAAAPTVSGGSIHLTGQRFDEDRSIFANTPQSVSTFTASFAYQASNVSAFNTSVGGATFMIQNSSSRASAVETFLSPTMLGSTAISPSAEITLELGGFSASGYYTNGASPGGSPSTSPLNLGSNDPIDVTITYNGSLLHESLVDTVTSAFYSTSYVTNIPAIVGGSTAYVGITAGNGLQEQADQVFSNFKFTASAPEPSAVGLMTVGAVLSLGIRRRQAR